MNEQNTNNTFNDEAKALSWDDTITIDSGDFITLKPGEYNFTVVDLQREYYEGSDKLPKCPKAVITCRINSAMGPVDIKNNLFLTNRTMGLLAAFFTSIGMKKKGEPLKMEWNKVVGATGRCKVGTREYRGDNYNDIQRFLPPVEAQDVPTATGYAPGRF